MVFQLITFFMLVINFKSAEMDLSLKLPVVGSARPVLGGDGAQLLVLNVKSIEGQGTPRRLFDHLQPPQVRRGKVHCAASLRPAWTH